MEYTEAARAVSDALAGGDDDLAAAGAMYLALQAWRHLADTDPVWDQFGLQLLEVQGQLYAGQDVVVEADPPRDGSRTRSAVTTLVEQLARRHEALSAEAGPLAHRLTHDACAQQLRRAVSVLA
jgi:hypothetical protein